MGDVTGIEPTLVGMTPGTGQTLNTGRLLYRQSLHGHGSIPAGEPRRAHGRESRRTLRDRPTAAVADRPAPGHPADTHCRPVRPSTTAGPCHRPGHPDPGDHRPAR